MTPREGAPPGPAPRSYSEFMRSLAAKYNGENPGEAPPPQDPRLQPKPAPLHFPQGTAPFPFPPFLFPPADGLKDPPFPFLPGLRPPLHPGLLEPAQAQALLTMMRAGVQHNPARPPQPLQPSEPPAKRARRGSSCVEEQPVSPPASRVPAAGLAAGCISLCSTSQVRPPVLLPQLPKNILYQLATLSEKSITNRNSVQFYLAKQVTTPSPRPALRRAGPCWPGTRSRWPSLCGRCRPAGSTPRCSWPRTSTAACWPC